MTLTPENFTGLTFFAECDKHKCSNSIEIDESNFQEAINSMKQLHWQIRKNSEGEWIHICPACVEDERNEKAGNDLEDRI